MAMNDVVLQTVKRMVSSGVDDNTIRMTLQGINIPEEEIQAVINEAKGIKPSETRFQQSGETEGAGDSLQGQVPSPDDDTDDGVLDDGDAEDYDESEEDFPEPSMRKEAEAISQEQAAQHTTTHTYLEEQGQKIDDVQKNMQALHVKVDSSPKISSETIGKIDSLDKRMSSLEKEIGETKANTIALQDLLKKILETDKKTLLKLEK